VRRLAPVIALLAAAACSSSSAPADGGAPGADTACGRDTRADKYVAGLAKLANELEVRIADAKPAPPATGENEWTVTVVTASTGAPVDGATLEVVPFMPDHGHGSAVKPVVTPAGVGRFDVKRVYLSMAGLWKVTVVVKLASGEIREAVFNFCLDG